MSCLFFGQTIFLYFTACDTYIDKYIIAKTDDSSYCNSGTAESISIWWGQSFTLFLGFCLNRDIFCWILFRFTFCSNLMGTIFYSNFSIFFLNHDIFCQFLFCFTFCPNFGGDMSPLVPHLIICSDVPVRVIGPLQIWWLIGSFLILAGL